MIFPGLAVAGVLAAVFAFLVLFQRTLYGSALCLLGVLLQIALIYFILGAQVLAFIQVLVYAGAVMVLIVMAVMTAPPRLTRLWAEIGRPRWVAASLLAAPAVLTGILCLAAASPAAVGMPTLPDIEHEMAKILFGPYALMTETAGIVVLLSALALVVAER